MLCECGEITGVACAWYGPREGMALVEHMPESFRASHEAARTRGVYPSNGAVRLLLERTCADSLIDNVWTEEV